MGSGGVGKTFPTVGIAGWEAVGWGRLSFPYRWDRGVGSGGVGKTFPTVGIAGWEAVGWGRLSLPLGSRGGKRWGGEDFPYRWDCGVGSGGVGKTFPTVGIAGGGKRWGGVLKNTQQYKRTTPICNIKETYSNIEKKDMLLEGLLKNRKATPILLFKDTAKGELSSA